MRRGKPVREDGVPVSRMPSLTMTLSALDFALRSTPDPEPDVPVPTAPDAPGITPKSGPDLALTPSSGPPSGPLAASTAESGPVPATVVAGLTARGHRLFAHGDRLFISNASQLTADERTIIKAQKFVYIPFAEPWPEAAPLPPPRGFSISTISAPASLAQFLSTVSTPQADWHPDEPPSLDGIPEVILNLATDSLDWTHGSRVIGLTVGTLDGQLIRFLPFKFKGGGNLDEAAVKRFAERELRGKKITNANTRFDMHHSREWGIDLEEQGNTFSDILHTAALIDDHRKRFALDVLAQDYLGGVKVQRIDEQHMAEYAASDVVKREVYTVQLVGELRNKLYPELDEQELWRVQDLEDAVIPAVVEMEKNGAPLDLELLDQYGKECVRRYETLLLEIHREVGFAFDHTPKSWRKLFEHCGITLTEKSGKLTFAEDVVGKVTNPIIQKAHLAGQYSSLNSKTFKAYKEHIGPDGILRFDLNQLRGDEGGTVSGRFSAGFIQQVPNHDNHAKVFGEDLFPRRLFIPGAGDYLESDAQQIEYRLFAHYAKNASVLEAYRNDPGLSFHKMTWEMMKKYKPNMLYSHQKSFNFAKQYGAKSIKLAVMMGFITDEEGEEIRQAKRWDDPKLALIHEIENAYKQMMPEGNALLDYASHLAKPECDEFCRKNDALHRDFKHHGHVKTLLGRRSRFTSGYKTYIGLNRVLQGTAADIMKQKLVELHRERKRTGFVMRITVHDAVGGDALTPETKGLVAEVLNHQSFELRVPILWTVGTGKNWAACK